MTPVCVLLLYLVQKMCFSLKLEEGEIDVRLNSFKGCVVKQLQEQESRNRGL